MNGTRLHTLAEEYLVRLDAAARALPDDERRELLMELRAHLEAGLEHDDSDAAVRNLLQDLGSPEQVVASAAAESGGDALHSMPQSHGDTLLKPASRWGTVEVVAVLGLTVGTFVIPILGPVVGLCFAWASTRWTRREKAIATALTFLPVVVLAMGAAITTSRGPSHPVETPAPQQIEGARS